MRKDLSASLQLRSRGGHVGVTWATRGAPKAMYHVTRAPTGVYLAPGRGKDSGTEDPKTGPSTL